MTVQVFHPAGLMHARHWLLVAVAWLAPLSAAQYAWLVLRRINEPAPAAQAAAKNI